MSLFDASQSSIDALYALYAQRSGITTSKRSDGTLDTFALELNDTEASTIDADPDFIIIQESSIEISEPDSESTDPDLNGANYTTEPLESNPNVGSRGLRNGDAKSRHRSGLLKRILLNGWAEKVTSLALAMISLVPGLPLPAYRQGSTIYPYYYPDTVEPGEGVRVYLLDTGLNMRHPEFNGRLKAGVSQGQTEDDWDVDWLFPRVDTREWYYTQDPRNMLPVQTSCTYLWSSFPPLTPFLDLQDMSHEYFHPIHFQDISQ